MAVLAKFTAAETPHANLESLFVGKMTAAYHIISDPMGLQVRTRPRAD